MYSCTDSMKSENEVSVVDLQADSSFHCCLVAAMQKNLASVPRLGRSPGKENGNQLQYSCLEKSTDRGVWWGTVCGAHDRTIQQNILSY